MQGEKPFGWCFIGTGRLAKKVADQILPSGRHRIVSVYTRRWEAGEEFAAAHGATAFASAREAIKAEGVEGVYIVTPHNSHYEYTKMALELGLPVLCEKAFTVDARQAEELIALAREKGLYLAEAMWTWFAPTAHKVKEWLDQGEFGQIQSLSIAYQSEAHTLAARITDPNTAGGALLDVGVYPITYLYRLFGMPEKLTCKAEMENGVDMAEEVDMTFPGGLHCTAKVAIKGHGKFEELAIQGTKACVSVPGFHHAKGATLLRRDGRSEEFSGDGSWLNEFNLVAGEIREGLTESRLVPLDATLDVMRLLDRCRRQINLVYPFEKK